MKKFFVGAVILVSVVFYGCGSDTKQPEQNNAAEKAVTTPEDSLYKAVLKLHDEAMPKMGQLIALQKAAQSKIDSLGSLKGADAKQLIGRLGQLKAQLASAEKGMNDWMEQFNPDPDSTITKDPVAYFTDQKAKAQLMRDNIFIALDSAAALLKQ